MAAYSFADVHATFSGAGGNFSLSDGGVAEEGISIEYEHDLVDTMTGADGVIMHSSIVSYTATITVRLLKTSESNGKLSSIIALQHRTSASLVGNNVITINNPISGDSIVCTQMAFQHQPTNSYARVGNVLEYTFKGLVSTSLGNLSAVTV